MGTDDDIDGVVFHLHPGEVAGLVVAAEQGLGAQLEIALEAGVFGQLRRLFQFGGGQLERFAKSFVVGPCDQPAVLVPADKSVEAAQVLRALGRFGRGGFEFLLGDVRGIVVGAGRFRAGPLDERFIAGQTVPGAVVDLGVAAHAGVGDAGQQRVEVAVSLLLKKAVHHVGGLDEEREHPPLVFRKDGQVAFEPEGGVVAKPLLDIHCFIGGFIE